MQHKCNNMERTEKRSFKWKEGQNEKCDIVLLKTNLQRMSYEDINMSKGKYERHLRRNEQE